MERHIRNMKTPLFAAVVFLTGLFLLESPGGNFIGWMDNDVCYRIWGCNAGFFGFDFLVHLTSAAAMATLIAWLMKHYDFLNISHGGFFAKFVVIIACVALFGVMWETGEFIHDRYQTNILQEDLRNPVNLLDQPSNADTVGDLFASVSGAALALIIGRFIKKDLL